VCGQSLIEVADKKGAKLSAWSGPARKNRRPLYNSCTWLSPSLINPRQLFQGLRDGLPIAPLSGRVQFGYDQDRTPGRL